MPSDVLYLVKRTFINPKDPVETRFDIDIPATFTDLKAAKEEAKSALINEGYERDFFPIYAVNNGSSDWKYGDGVIVYAEGPSHELFKVEIETTPNRDELEPDGTGRIRRSLHHILQTIIHYDEDRSGSNRDSVVEGTYIDRNKARSQALKVLLDSSTTKQDFAAYDEYCNEVDSPFGADVIIHAVKENGENILVSVVSDYRM
jgi:hypothetical protein